MAANITSEVTAAQLAAQFGFGTTHGAVAWRVMLNSPLDSERCRVLVRTISNRSWTYNVDSAAAGAG
jgi:hypothetical protein